MIDTIKNIPDVKIKIVENGNIIETTSRSICENKKIVIFGVPGAFTSTCSIKHFPSYIENANNFKKKGIDKIFCLSVNDPSVMKAWQSQYSGGDMITMIADGNGDLTKTLELDQDYSSSFMGVRSKRFALVANNNKVILLCVESPKEFKVSSADNILKHI